MFLNLPLMRSFFFFPGEWLDLGEHDYRIFGSQLSELERVSIDLSQGSSPENTRSGVIKGRLGALKGSTTACAESPSTPKNPIVELIDSDDDAFDKIVGMGRVTRSAAAAKGLSPLAGIVAHRAGGARKDPALDSGNVVSTKHAPRDPIKFCSPGSSFTLINSLTWTRLAGCIICCLVMNGVRSMPSEYLSLFFHFFFFCCL